MAQLVEITNTAWTLGGMDWWHKGKDKKSEIARDLKSGDTEIVCAEEKDIGEGNTSATRPYLRTTITLIGVDASGKSHTLVEYTTNFTIVK